MCFLFWKKKKNQDTYKNEYQEILIDKSEAVIVEEVSEDVVEHVKKSVKRKYHVSQNKDKDAEHFKKWRIRKEGSEKTIQFFDTQKEAIDFAQDLADNIGTTVVIHKIDGSIRKQDYTKKT